MKKIKKYILTFIFMLVGVLFVNNYAVLAEGEEPGGETGEEGSGEEIPIEPVIDTDQFVVINPDSEGNAKNKIDDIQYTRVREIDLLIKLDMSEYHSQKFDVCEQIPNPLVEGQDPTYSERCSSYPTNKTEAKFQIAGANDGEKIINIYFYNKNDLLVKENTVTKKITLDTTGPVITLVDGEYLFVKRNQSYREPGATCVDDSGYTEGNCSVTIEDANIDMNSTEYQYIRYTARDFLQNETIVVRKIIVEAPEEKKSNSYWLYALGAVGILAAYLGYVVIKNKDKQKNQSVL